VAGPDTHVSFRDAWRYFTGNIHGRILHDVVLGHASLRTDPSPQKVVLGQRKLGVIFLPSNPRLIRFQAMNALQRRKHAEVARLAEAAQILRKLKPRPTIEQIADILGVTYWAARHYVYDECKAVYRLGR
jgi:hypothetical protein